jgi:hypothetical protein
LRNASPLAWAFLGVIQASPVIAGEEGDTLGDVIVTASSAGSITQ